MSEAPSPFLPNTWIQYAWDSTSLGLLKTCPRLYQYQMIDGWSLSLDNIHLRWGIEYHAALQDYDISKAKGSSHEDAIRYCIHELMIRIHDWNPDPNLEKRSEKVKTKDALIRSVVWYLDHFKEDPAKTVIMKDGRPGVEVSFRFELDFGPQKGYIDKNNERNQIVQQPYLLCGHLDRIVNFQDHIFVMDRKTTSSTPGQYYFDQYDVNNQMTLYTVAGQIVLNQQVQGVIVDAIQIATEFSRPVRGMTYRSKDQIAEWMVDLRHWLALAEQYALANYWPMNDTSCDKFGGCRFRQICSKSPQVRETMLKSNFKKGERWNPLRSR